MTTKIANRFDRSIRKAGLTNPTPGDVHVNTALSTFAQKYLLEEDMFVSTRAFPNLPVQHKSDEYYVFDKSDFFRDEAEERQDGSESAGTQFNLSQDTYRCKVNAIHKDIGDQTMANADSPVQLVQSSTQLVMHKLMIRRERLFATTFMDPAAWGANTLDLATTVQWNVPGSSPITEARNAARQIQSTTGRRPNKMIIGRALYDALLDNADVLSRIEGGATTTLPALVMRNLLASVFEIDEILVLDSIFTTSARGAATPTYEFIGANQALLYHAPSSVSIDGTPTAGIQFSWTGMFGMSGFGIRMKKFRMEEVESDRVEGQMAFDYKVTGPELGFFFDNGIA